MKNLFDKLCEGIGMLIAVVILALVLYRWISNFISGESMGKLHGDWIDEIGNILFFTILLAWYTTEINKKK